MNSSTYDLTVSIFQQAPSPCSRLQRRSNSATSGPSSFSATSLIVVLLYQGRWRDGVLFCNVSQRHANDPGPTPRPRFTYAAIRLTEGEDTRTFCYSGLKSDDSLDESRIVTSRPSPNVGHNLERSRRRDNYTIGRELLDLVLGI